MCLGALRIYGGNGTRLALHGNKNRPAANSAVFNGFMAAARGVDGDGKRFPAPGTVDVFLLNELHGVECVVRGKFKARWPAAGPSIFVQNSFALKGFWRRAADPWFGSPIRCRAPGVHLGTSSIPD